MGQARKISLFAFDLDGTLLNDVFDISDYTLSKIHQAMAMGAKVTTSSARIPTMQQVFVGRLGFQGPYIACNGGLIVNSADGTVLNDQPIEDSVLKRLFRLAREARMHLSLQTSGDIYYTKDNPRIERIHLYNRVAAKYGYPSAPIAILDDDYGNYDGSPTYKVLIYTPEEEKFQVLVNFLDSEEGLVYTFSEPNLFDITRRGTDKGMGIEIVAGYYGIPLEEVCAFGDFDNDIPIFEKVGTRVAMGNASENLKARADFITDFNYNDGVGKAVEKLLRYI